MMRVAGHALTIEFSGERSRDERSSTGYCRCGWEESASTQAEVRNEYRWHLHRVQRDALAAKVEALTAEVEHLRANQRVNHATVETGPGNRLDFFGDLPTRVFEP